MINAMVETQETKEACSLETESEITVVYCCRGWVRKE